MENDPTAPEILKPTRTWTEMNALIDSMGERIAALADKLDRVDRGLIDMTADMNSRVCTIEALSSVDPLASALVATADNPPSLYSGAVTEAEVEQATSVFGVALTDGRSPILAVLEDFLANRAPEAGES